MEGWNPSDLWLAGQAGAVASMWMEDWSSMDIAEFRAQAKATEAAHHAFRARPDLKREA